MNRAGVTSLILMVMVAGCEKGVKPVGAPAPKAGASVKKESIDQTPELEGHPRALYDQPRQAGLVRDTTGLNKQIDATMRLLAEPEEKAQPRPVAKDGFIQTANHFCPIMQKMKLNDTTAVEHTVEFEGKVVGFCCEDCLDAWASMTDDERRERVKTVMEKK